MKKPVDAQTHADVVQLIETEMAEVACGNYPVSGDRLASLIEGRLGHEKPKSFLPDITQGDWEREIFSRSVAIKAPSGYICMPIHGPDMANVPSEMPDKECLANARLIAAAPKLAEAAYNIVKECDNTGIISQELQILLCEALREAGADI
jgi:hypothetical protein